MHHFVRGRKCAAAAAVAGRISLLFLLCALSPLGCRSGRGPEAPQPAPVVPGPPGPPRAGSAAAPLTVSFVDIGQGDATLIQTPSGKNILIDSGPAAGREALLQYLEDRNVRELEAIIATHPHLDHIGNMPQVLEAVPVVREFLDSGLVTGSPAQERMLRAIKAKRVKFSIVSRGLVGTTRDLGDGVTLKLLQPRAPLLTKTDSDPNNNSVVVLLTRGRVRFLLTGDMEEDEREKRLYPDNQGELPAEIYKVAHHGSRNGTDDAFMQRVQPKEAVISCGVANDYGHPHPEAMAALAKVGARVWRTDEQGTIVVTTDGEDYDVTTLGKSADSPKPGRGSLRERRGGGVSSDDPPGPRGRGR